MGKPRISQDKIDGITSLRQKGHSIPEIHKILKLPKSTVLKYCRGVEILPEFKQRWLDRRNASKIISERQRKVAKDRSVSLIGDLDNQSLVLILASLYWAEGAKKDFSFTNSDPVMIKVFISILKKAFNIKNEEIKVSIRLYEDLLREESINFWSEIIGFDLHDTVSVNLLEGKKKGKLKYGMCRVRVKKSGLLLKTIFAINKRVASSISS